MVGFGSRHSRLTSVRNIRFAWLRQVQFCSHAAKYTRISIFLITLPPFQNRKADHGIVPKTYTITYSALILRIISSPSMAIVAILLKNLNLIVTFALSTQCASLHQCVSTTQFHTNTNKAIERLSNRSNLWITVNGVQTGIPDRQKITRPGPSARRSIAARKSNRHDWWFSQSIKSQRQLTNNRINNWGKKVSFDTNGSNREITLSQSVQWRQVYNSVWQRMFVARSCDTHRPIAPSFHRFIHHHFQIDVSCGDNLFVILWAFAQAALYARRLSMRR